MIEQFVSISDKIDNQLQQISASNPQWRIAVTKEYKVYNGDEPPIGWQDDWLTHIMIHGPGWRAWLAPRDKSNADEYILPEYNNCIHLYKKVAFSKPLVELLETADGQNEILRSDKYDRVCKLPDTIDPFNQLDAVVDILKDLPTEPIIEHILWRIKEIDDSIRDIDFMMAEFTDNYARKKHALTLMFIIADAIATIPLNIHTISHKMVNPVTNGNHPKPTNTCVHALYKFNRRLAGPLRTMRNELCHDSLWYPDAPIKPNDDTALLDFWQFVKTQWKEQKARFDSL